MGLSETLRDEFAEFQNATPAIGRKTTGDMSFTFPVTSIVMSVVSAVSNGAIRATADTKCPAVIMAIAGLVMAILRRMVVEFGDLLWKGTHLMVG